MTLLELLGLMRRHLKLVIALPVALALAAGAGSLLLMRDVYTASTSMYVLAQQDASSNATLSADLSASQMISNDVATLLLSDRVKDGAASQAGVGDLRDYDVAVTSETTSRVITLAVTGPDPEVAAAVANAMVANVSGIARDVMEVESVNPIDQAQTPTRPSGPNRLLYVIAAGVAGLFLATAIVVVADMLNTRVRDASEVEELLGIPVIGRVPVMGGR